MKIRELGVARLTIHRTPQHIYAQVFDSAGGKVLAAASTVQEKVAKGLKGTGNVEAAKAVGTAIAEAAKAAGVTQGRVRSRGIHVSRPRQSAGRRGARSGPRVLIRT